MKLRHYLIHYSEVGLKRGNRALFEDRLIKNIYKATRGLGVEAVHRLYGRFRLDQQASRSKSELEARLARVYGISHFFTTEIVELDLEALQAEALRHAAAEPFESFGVRAKRINKGFPYNSEAIGREVGRVIANASGARVDLNQPERWFHVLVLNREIYLYSHRVEGPRGLPIGCSGKVAVLLSGGIDSPVAADRLLRRGCPVTLIHFHSAPFTDKASIRKALRLSEILTEHRLTTTLYLVPLAELQRQIAAQAPPAYRIVLYRCWMVRLANRIARADRCLALATGDAIGQVASQTLEHLQLFDAVSELPILRPLIALDKEEITELARQSGTFETSIEPDSDSCSYLMPRNPVTRPRPEELEAIEAELDLEAIAEDILNRVERAEVGPDAESKAIWQLEANSLLAEARPTTRLDGPACGSLS